MGEGNAQRVETGRSPCYGDVMRRAAEEFLAEVVSLIDGVVGKVWIVTYGYDPIVEFKMRRHDTDIDVRMAVRSRQGNDDLERVLFHSYLSGEDDWDMDDWTVPSSVTALAVARWITWRADVLLGKDEN